MIRTILILLAISFLTVSCFKKASSRPENIDSDMQSEFYNFKMNAIDGTEIDFGTYKGKKVMLVNVASECGFTPQYEGLQELHEKYKEDLVILGFPANNFGGQEPGSNEEIAGFCKKNYGVDFQMFEKISVKGDDMHPLYQWLSDKDKNGWNNDAPNWNFCKYVIDENGQLTHFFQSAIKPMGPEIQEAIQ